MQSNSNAEVKLSNAERQARFKANQAFKSLPLDVQHSIDRISDSPEEKAQWTAIALCYEECCRVCGHVLPRLEQPRQYRGVCLDCALHKMEQTEAYQRATYTKPVSELSPESVLAHVQRIRG